MSNTSSAVGLIIEQAARFKERHTLRDVPFLFEGSADERSRGLFIFPRTEDDNTKFSAIRPYSETVVFGYGFYPSREEANTIIKELGLETLSGIFSVNSIHGESVAYFFKMSGTNIFLIVTINVRYGDIAYSIMEGTPSERCNNRPRSPRSSEIEKYLENPSGWISEELPILLEKPPSLADIHKAQQKLRLYSYVSPYN